MALAPFPRKGAWAKLADGTVGIINSIEDGHAEFHGVNAKGETISVVGMYVQDKKRGRVLEGGVPLSMLKQAGHGEIPKDRRPTKEHGAFLGYK
jgi:hypothetical protein